MIPYSRQLIDDEDVAAVLAVLKSDFLTCGPAVPHFEKAVAEWCRESELQGVAVASATAALHLACQALGVGEGDWVWTSPISFVASANCARYCGARVDFVDVDAVTGLMDVHLLEAKLAQAEQQGRLPKVVIPVHYAGRAVDMAAVSRLAKKYGFYVMEDAAHALGANYADGSHIGHAGYSDAVIFSFHPVKPVTTGEGGMIMTRDPVLAERLRTLRTHGITREETVLEQKNVGPWYYEMHDLGMHYRITDIQAALGASQMRKLEKFIDSRRKMVARYDERLRGLPLRLPPIEAGCGWHLYAVQVDAARRRHIFDRLRTQGISVNVHYIPIPMQPYYRKQGFKPGDFPKAEAFYAREISLPVFQGMKEAEQDKVIAALQEILT